MRLLKILSATLVFYGRTAERQLILLKEQAKVVGAIQKTKSLSLETFGNPPVPCGYGIRFLLPDTILIFEDQPKFDLNNDCSYGDNAYVISGVSGSNDRQFEEIKLDKKVKFSVIETGDPLISADPGALNIIFIPPNPKTIINNDNMKDFTLIKIQTIDGLAEKTIKVSNSGQITMQ